MSFSTCFSEVKSQSSSKSFSILFSSSSILVSHSKSPSTSVSIISLVDFFIIIIDSDCCKISHFLYFGCYKNVYLKWQSLYYRPKKLMPLQKENNQFKYINNFLNKIFVKRCSTNAPNFFEVKAL